MLPSKFSTFCNCFKPNYSNEKWGEIIVHDDNQDRTSEAWYKLLELIDLAEKDQRKTFSPKQDLGNELWSQIKVLPKEIAKLIHVTELNLYGSHLVRIPPEIGFMQSLVKFEPYTSYSLHWFPYEITRCKNLKQSTISTRALYGNYKVRAPFPRLKGNPIKFHDKPKCSICDNENYEHSLNQLWVSLLVGTDTIPLLVQTCSKACLEQVPKTPNGDRKTAHKGGF